MTLFQCAFGLMCWIVGLLLKGHNVNAYVPSASHTGFRRQFQRFLREIPGDLLQVTERSSVRNSVLDNHHHAVSKLKFHLLEEKDLNRAALLSLNGFYKPRFVLNSAHMSPVEAVVLGGVAGLLQTVDRFDAWIANYWGFRSRGGKRLRFPNLNNSLDSVIIVATAPKSALEENKNKCRSEHPEELVGIVEVCLEEPTGLLFPPLQNLFRRKDMSRLQPYLCNLCIAKSYRRIGLGKVMCHICENVATQVMGKTQMFLHVENDNLAAQSLYKSLGYEKIQVLSPKEIREHNLGNIDYFRKDLQS